MLAFEVVFALIINLAIIMADYKEEFPWVIALISIVVATLVMLLTYLWAVKPY